MVLDGEIAVPDDRGVTHLDGLSEAIADHQPAVAARLFRVRSVASRRPRFRRCPIEDPKMLLRDLIGAARCERIVYVDHLLGKELFEAVREIGAVVSKRRGSLYRGGESREWLKTKCSETGVFAVTGFSELGGGRLDAVYVAEARDGILYPAGQVRFGFAGKGLSHLLNERRAEPARKSIVPGASLTATIHSRCQFPG
jgi:bifunctional non-homologous end joining protein LigD